MCTFCLWPQTHSGHRWRVRSSDDVANECRYVLENFPGLKESSSTTIPSTTARIGPSTLCSKFEEAELHRELHVTRDHRLRHAQGHESCRLPPADCRL